MSGAKLSEEAIFDVAIRIESPEVRADYLQQVCGDDSALRDRVNRLLEIHDRNDGFLEAPPSALQATKIPGGVSEKPGDVIGPYKLLQEIGDGGFGVVYMAEQTRPVRRKVALKVIKPGMDTRDVVARFEAERQALAMMDHPNIAKVLDGGETDSGRPYFVMELVKGVPLTEFCDSNKLSTRERLVLFITICQAVQHAHQKGVIHRDLKPNNVMVTLHDNRPVPMIIDFGVSKAISQQLTEKTLFTAYGQMVGTPIYMSPEQAQMSGLDIDTRSDIYSLGVLLYELLTGTTPLVADQLRGTAYAEVQRLIREEESPKPSTRLSTLGEDAGIVADQRSTDIRRLGQFIRGDLDWVVMKALEKDRNRRYDTASNFAADIERFLQDEPVEACPPSLSYQLRKYVRRHRGVVTAGSAVALTLLLGIIGTTLGMLRARRDADEAQRAREVATQAVSEERDARLAAQQAMENERVARVASEEKEQQLQEQSYFQLIHLAQVEMEKGRPGAALRLLDECPPHLQHWEWHYLRRLACSANLESVQIEMPDVIQSCVWSPVDNKQAVVWTEDGSLTVLNVETDQVTQRLLTTEKYQPKLGRFQCLKFSPDGAHVALLTHATGYRLIDIQNGEVVGEMDHPDPLTALAFHPDPHRRQIATAARKGKVRFWSWEGAPLNDSELQHRRQNNYRHMTYSPDGRWIAAGGFMKWLTVWSAKTGAQAHTHKGDVGPTLCFEFSHDSQLLAEGTVGQHVILWDTKTGEKRNALRGHADSVFGITFSPDDKRCLSSSRDETVRLWELPSGREVLTFKPRVSNLGRLAFSEDGNRVLLESKTRILTLFDATPGATQTAPLKTFQYEERVFDVEYSSDGSRIVWAGERGVGVWDLATETFKPFTELGPEKFSMGGSFYVALHPDGKQIATCPAGSFRVLIWDPHTGEIVHQSQKWAIDQPSGVAFTPDGRWLVTSGSQLLKWDTTIPLADQQPVEIVKNENDVDYFAKLSSDGRFLANADKRSVVLFDAGQLDRLQEGEELVRFDVPTSFAGLEFSPDGEHVACADSDGDVFFISTAKDDENKRTRVTWRASDFEVTDFAFTPNGEYMATSSRDETIRIWRVATQKLVQVFVDESILYCVAFSPDGTRLVSGNDDGQIKVWDTAVLNQESKIVATPQP